MKIIRNSMLAAGLAALIGAGAVTPADAATIAIVPADQTAAVGDPVNVDVVLSGLTAGETVGGYSFELSYDDSILGAPQSFVVDPDGAMGVASLDLSGGFTVGGSPLDVFVLADIALDEPSLKALQAVGFVLARVSFMALAEGLTSLSLAPSPAFGAFLSDFDGLNEVAANAANGRVCVDNAGGDCRTVPEPATLALLGAGLGVLAVRRRLAASRA
jgi:hypothetical protein